MKPIVLTAVAIVSALSFQPSFAQTGGPAADTLVDKLAEKGVLTETEAKEIKEKTDQKAPFDQSVLMQARLDFGDLMIGTGGLYETESDLYLRRARIEIDKKIDRLPAGRELELNITLDADRADQDFEDSDRNDPGNEAQLRYLYADWIFTDAFALKVGKHKLPFSRVSLTSSARQLLIDRPVTTETARDGLGDYNQTQLQFHGGLSAGRIRYYISVSDGANNLSAVEGLDPDATIVRNQAWGNAYVMRLELSAAGEKKKDDTGIGREDHFTLGLNAGLQNNVKYSTTAVADATADLRLIGVDFAGRGKIGAGILTGQAEYVKFKKLFTYKTNERPKGRYAQLGYLLPGTILNGRLEPAVRYESFDMETILNPSGGETDDERVYTIGFNHYLSDHAVKWSYNYVSTRFEPGVAETTVDRTRKIHQVMMQIAF